MHKKNLDPGLAAILASIRASVDGEAPGNGEVDMPEVAETSPAPPPPTAPVRSVEDFLADLARPHVKAWVDANLPEIIQKLAAEEVRRLVGS